MLSGDSGICGYVSAATVVLGINPVDHKVGLIISPLELTGKMRLLRCCRTACCGTVEWWLCCFPGAVCTGYG